MNKIINFFLIVLSVILQLTIASRLSIGFGMFNLPLIVLTSLILIQKKEYEISWIFSGLLLDLLSPVKSGYFFVTFLLVYFINNALTKRIFHKVEFYVIILFFALNTLIIDLPFLFNNFSYQILLGNIIYNVIFGYLVFWLIRYYLQPQTIIKVEL